IDNEALAVLEPTRPAVVWLVTPADNAYFFEQALATMDPLVWAEQSLTMTPERYEQVAAGIAASTASTPAAEASSPRAPDLVVFNGYTPRLLPAHGRFVCIGQLPREVGATIAGRLESPQLFLDPRPHPLTEHISLQGARLAQAPHVSLTQPARVLASTADGHPLIFLSEQGDRQALCIAFNVLESDLPFRNAFPLLLRNAVAYMHSETAPWLRPSYRIGQTVTPTRPIPASISSLTLDVLREPKSEQVPLEVRDGRFAFSDTQRPAALRLTIGDDSALATVSLLDAAESRTTPVPTPADPSQTLGLSRRLFSTVPWVALAGLAMLLISLEWLTYHLRWTE
ncbi:MAG TPA: hypothetical protein VFF65_07230, partial [Phycisphaerales bacterium]|nr:hypothetical protein [Phycisphaerales bacterium]